MRKIEGLVCTVRFTQPRTQELLFGPNTGGSAFNHQKFTTNELTPFDNQERATQGLEGLRIRKNLGYTRLGLATISMELASSDSEWEVLRRHNNYIVVAGVDGGYILLGKGAEGVPGVAHAPVSDLERNGFKTIRDFGFLTDNWGIVAEVRRQGRPYTSQIATFELKRLKLA